MNIQEKIETVIEFVLSCAKEFGGLETKTSEEPKDFVFRNNTKPTSLDQGGAYFGFISGNEEFSGRYNDLSLVFFPANNDTGSWLMAIGVGTLGFKNDYELANLPGIRRRFLNILSPNGFAKTSLIDMESDLPKSFKSKLSHLKNTLKSYSKLLPICEIITEPLDKVSKDRIRGFIAAYADMREWATNNNHRKLIINAISKISNKKNTDNKREITELLNQRRYIILQGAPGTGKTFLANQIAVDEFSKTFFIQFHAETTYSDFIFGIFPTLNNHEVNYEGKNGIFLKSLFFALDNPTQKVLLIVDEINRANLSNILGPIFYLFEYGEKNRRFVLNLGIEKRPISNIPDNFHVLATMNTADRSLAVIDFALRRRFAWYTLYPRALNKNELSNQELFFIDLFEHMHSIFEKFATNNELVFEPGQSYFIAKDLDIMNTRLKYELLPLIKEYLEEGILISAREEFLSFFREHLGDEINNLWL